MKTLKLDGGKQSIRMDLLCTEEVEEEFKLKSE